MPELMWGSNLELGVAAMDAQHRQLIEAMQDIQRLSESMSADAAEQLARGLDRLLTLTRRHFEDEERHMEAIGYVDRVRHARIHQDMLERLADYRQQFEDGDGRLPVGLLRFLVYWLSAHIQGIDRKYADVTAPVRH